ncbi:hypothetical protein HYH03_014472 [Edaphochlamys debaryana]|uniref:Uncharacterized protein n=1 Tax=Edaphochlamys debaryana TaxID=47281 RepID=A0A835XQ17_9CHLO|nr:hypothetical protein HYH03_014472 [Edaphochlamys debaryana]|eukprot:KAG2486878.1 hypothetical protein HYH03_014472 [Edaphochlamys debaryana]
MSDRRPKRRCVAAKSQVPSAIHYVGYVEDDETPEAIMKKFEELERIQKAAEARRQQQQAQPVGDNDAAPTASGPSPTAAEDGGAAPRPSTVTAQPNGQQDGGLDEEALLEVFRQTSIFNVRSALANNDVLHEGAGGAGGADGAGYGGDAGFFDDGGEGSDAEEELAYLKGFWSDEDFELPGGKAKEARRRRGGGKAAGPREPRQPRAPGTGHSRHVLHQVVTQYNRDTNALIRRRIRIGAAAAAGGGLVQLRVPNPPLPLSWGRTVRPYRPPKPRQPPMSLEAEPATLAEPAAAASTSRGYEVADLVSFPYDKVLGGKQYIAVLVNAGWQTDGALDAYDSGGEAAVMARLKSLPLPRLCPRGFIMVWAHKGLLHGVCRVMAAWGYAYIENLTWVHLNPANGIAKQHGRFFKRSHTTLLMFRKEGEGRDIELRHQRSPDVVFDCVRSLPGGAGWQVPGEVMTTVETMLPTAKGALLELWAPRGARRPGWDHVTEAL